MKMVLFSFRISSIRERIIKKQYRRLRVEMQ